MGLPLAETCARGNGVDTRPNKDNQRVRQDLTGNCYLNSYVNINQDPSSFFPS